MIVYVVMTGEYGQGGSIRCVKETKAKAKAVINGIITAAKRRGQNWVGPVPDPDEGEDFWDCDGDWMRIETHEVT